MPRPRKTPPVDVPEGSKYCFSCRSTLPLLSFATDAKNWDGKKLDCRKCDSTAASLRADTRRRMLRNQRLAAGLAR